MKDEPAPWYVYMLICNDETIYTGIAMDPQKRLAEHNNGAIGAKYTRSRRPVSLAYLEEFPSRSTAASREYQLKKLNRQQKLQLIRSSGYQRDSS
ncbi:MAG: GIY-YIG nuclease family protein [Thermodesulfobacteriota bacterium]